MSNTTAVSSVQGVNKNVNALMRFWPFVEPYRILLFGVLLAVPLVSTLGLIPPYLIMHGIDTNLQGREPHTLLTTFLTWAGWTEPLTPGMVGLSATCALFFVFIGLDYVGKSLQSYLLQLIGYRSVGALRTRIYRHVTGQSASFFDRNPTGALLTRSTNDIEALGDSLTTGVVTIVGDMFNLLAISLFMLFLNPTLTLVTFCIAPILIMVVNYFQRKLKESYIDVRKTLSDVNAFMQEHLSGVRLVQLFNQEARTVSTFKSRNVLNLRANQSSNIYDAALYAVMEGMASLSIALLLWYGGLKVLSGVLTVGLLAAFIEYTQKVYVPIKEFSSKVAQLQQAVAAIERVSELLDTHQEITPGEVALQKATGDIVFEKVGFAYSEKGGTVLKEVSFQVKPGQVVALVGSTGSGKTTVGKVLTRMYDGYTGSVRLEGHELRTLTPDSVREKIGVVQQDVVLFNGSIAFNISLGNPQISLERVQEAAKLVQADVFIQELPGGYDFEVSERGSNLSAGQAQLIAFARVMAHDPPIVMLDEATASIDSQTEALIQLAIAEIFKRKTALVIAHRLSTIQAADCILVMQLGQIIEFGTHAELLALGGVYANLYTHGFSEEGAKSSGPAPAQRQAV